VKKRTKKPSVKKPLTLRQLHDRARAQAARRQNAILAEVAHIGLAMRRIEKVQEIILAVLRPVVSSIRNRPLQISEMNRAAFEALVDGQAKDHPEMFS
jgi:hypothetical protein